MDGELNLKKLFLEAQAEIIRAGKEQEKTKAGKLRGGNSAVLTEDGRFIGKCPSLTYLRYKGVDTFDVDQSRELMFEAGRGNEDLWYDVLKDKYDGPILREEEIPTKWLTDHGVEVTGRPDIVLCAKETNKPVLGIELKLVSSVWTARDVAFKKMPKLDHLIQAAHYSWQLNCPFELWYTSRADFAVMGWMQKHFPKLNEPGSEHCEYNDKGDIKKVCPFIQGYRVKINELDSFIYYQDVMDDTDGRWHRTELSIDGLKRYYEFITEMDEYGKVPPEPFVLKADGSEAGYKASTYCDLGELCCGSCEGQDLGEWFSKVKEKYPSGS